MADSCQEEKRSLPNCFSAVFFAVMFQGTFRGGTCVATANQTDIRGLGTARLVFVAELPLSSNVSSAKGLIQ
jgi:hypothetical protein